MCKYSLAFNENTTSNCSNERIPLIINKDNSKKKKKTTTNMCTIVKRNMGFSYLLVLCLNNMKTASFMALRLLAIVARQPIWERWVTCVSLLGYNSGPHAGATHRDHLGAQLELVLDPRPSRLFLFCLPSLRDAGVRLEVQEEMGRINE